MSNQENPIQLPAPMQALLEQSQVNMVSINLQKVDKELSLTASKVGGIGYLPESESYPYNADGTPLALLVQINFAEVASTVELSQLPQPLPKSGILQIYIDVTDDFYGADDLYGYGADFDNHCSNEKYQVRFWQDITLPINQTALDIAKAELEKLSGDNDDYYLPFNHTDELAITFKKETQPCTIKCYEFAQYAKNISELKNKDIWQYIEENNIENPDDVYQTYSDFAHIGDGHHLLGYPDFAQEDPRGYNEELQQHILLLQIDSDINADICWGDCGIANFFITPDDLKNKDFSRLLYNWDCS